MGGDEKETGSPGPMDKKVNTHDDLDGLSGRQMRYWKRACWEWRIGFTPVKIPDSSRWHFIVTWDGWTHCGIDPQERASMDESCIELRGPVRTMHITNFVQASRWFISNIRIPAVKEQGQLIDAIFDMSDAPKEMPDRSDDD